MFNRTLINMCTASALLLVIPLSGNGSEDTSSLRLTMHKDWRQTPKLYIPSGSAKMSGSGRATSDAFIEANKSFFKVNPGDLKFDGERDSLLGTHYRYVQYINEIRVDDSELVVSVSKNGTGVYQCFNATFPYTQAPGIPRSVIDRATALDTAWDTLRVHGLLYKLPSAELNYLVTGAGTFKLVYKTQVTVSSPRGQWEHVVDAITGEVLSLRDKTIYKKPVQTPDFSAYNGPVVSRAQAEKAFLDGQARAKNLPPTAYAPANGTAQVFDADPRTYLASDTLNDSSATSAFSSAYVTRTLSDISLNAGTYSLTGPWVSIIDFDPPNTPPSTTSTGDWTATRGSNAFNDAMSYFHIDQNQRYLQSLGYSGSKGIQQGSLQVDSNGADGADNSYYLPGTNQLSFGHGGVDDNEDADVILHEYGHAITHDIVPTWGGGDTGAIGEGFGDYWGGSYSSTTINGSSYHPEWAFSWDGHNEYWQGRSMDRTDLIYDENLTYDAHQTIDGIPNYSDQLWSTPLFQAFLELRAGGTPRTEIDKVVIESFFGVGGSPSMRDLATAIVNTAALLYPVGPHAGVFLDKFQAQNIINGPDISITGNAQEISNNDVVPSMVDASNFGTVAVSATVAHSFTITNTGLSTLLLNGSPSTVAISGDTDFTISNQPASITLFPGNSTTFDILFAPTISGEQSATVSIANNVLGSSPFVFGVSGNGPSILELALSQESMTESGGVLTGTVYRTSDTTSPLSVSLLTNDPTEASVPESVEIQAGLESVTFSVSSVDDINVDGDQTVILTASASGHGPASLAFTVTDNDTAGGGGGGGGSGCLLGHNSPPSTLLCILILVMGIGIQRTFRGKAASTH